MPTYEYRRPDGSTFDVFQKMSADPLTHDPETGVPVTRVISGGAGLQFKGDGFYVTDYVRKNTPEGGSEPKGEPKKAPEPKPAAKATSDSGATSSD